MLRNPELLQRIFDDPTNRTAYAVYADWLTENGSFLGELIAADLAAEQGDASAAERAERIRKDHLTDLLGPIALRTDACVPRWERGFISHLWVGGTEELLTNGWDDELLWSEVAKIPHTELVRDLTIGPTDTTEFELGFDYQIVQLAECADRFPSLRALLIGDFARYGEMGPDLPHTVDHGMRLGMTHWELSWSGPADPGPLCAAFPDLEHLLIHTGSPTLSAPLDWPALRTLVVQSGGLPSRLTTHLARSALPRLESLVLWFGEQTYGGDCVIDSVRPLLDPGLFPGLRHLGLMNATFSDDIAVAVATAPLLAQLEWLDLSMGMLSDVGVLALAAVSPGSRLRYLNIGRSYVTDDAVATLREAWGGVDILAGEMKFHVDYPDLRYVSVSE